MRTLIRGATVFLPTGRADVSVVVEGERIAEIDPAPSVGVDETIDATGLWLLPGVIDDQVHFRDPGLIHKEDLTTASHACARGGVTTFLEMPNTKPETTTRDRLAEKLALAAGKSVVDFGFYIGATPDNLDELRLATRTPGIKIFLGSSTGDLLVDRQEDLERIFAETTLPIATHCEDEAIVRANAQRVLAGRESVDVAEHSRIRDHRAALASTERAIDLALRHRHRLHVLHVTTAAEVTLLAQTAAAGQGLVTAEACTHHLLLTVDDYPRLGTLAQVNPSLKTAADRDGLWAGLATGALQVVATDHAPHTREEKARPYPTSPSGLPAVENSLALMLDQAHRGRCTVEQVVRWMCDAPARVWDLVGKGRITPGYDADLVLVDPHQRRVIRNVEQLTKCGWSPWDGVELVGWPVRTLVRGRTVYADGRVVSEARGAEARFDHGRGGFWSTESPG